MYVVQHHCYVLSTKMNS